jgi:hypothetical protein
MKAILLVKAHLELEKGLITEKQITALSEILSYTDEESARATLSKNLSANAIYAWAAANSTIAFPYLSLTEASEKLSVNIEVPNTSWGLVGNKYKLVANESLDDSMYWLIINALLEKNFPGQVEYLEDIPDDFPMLPSGDLAKNIVHDTVFRRVLELSKNPLSATARNGTNLKASDVAKNAVDFVALEHIYNKSRDYENLRIGLTPIMHGRRIVNVEKKEPKGRISFQPVYTGYKLAEILAEFAPHNAKTHESAPLSVLLINLIRKMVDDALADDDIRSHYEVPNAFFETPSVQLRKELRKGPQIRTKNKGMKENLYAPFSFVKSSECSLMPVTTRKAATDLSMSVIHTLDKINKLEPSMASEELPLYRRFLNLAYVLSDTVREKWRKAYSIPDFRSIEGILNEVSFLDDINPDKVYFDSKKLEQAFEDVKLLTFEKVTSNQAELDAIKDIIEKASAKKKKTGSS